MAITDTGSYRPIAQFEIIQQLAVVGGMSDRVVRSLSRIKQGHDGYRKDGSLVEAQTLVAELAKQISAPSSANSRGRLDEAIMLFASTAGVGTSSAGDSLSADANPKDIADFLEHLANSLGNVISGGRDDDSLEFALSQFDALAEATLNSATERSDPKVSAQVWATT